MNDEQNAPRRTLPFLLPGSPLWFPDPNQDCSTEGLIAVGGDLSVQRLIYAYSHGIFPWYDQATPILWWSPDPRFVLFPDQLQVPGRLARSLRNAEFEISCNRDFEQVIRACAAAPRPGQSGGTWLVAEMIAAYLRLHQQGYAVSAEAWQNGNLVGGCYGVLLGRVLFGESMFHTRTNASRACLLFLLETLGEQGLQLVDCQQYSPHLEQLGARFIARHEFVSLLKRAIPDGIWNQTTSAT